MLKIFWMILAYRTTVSINKVIYAKTQMPIFKVNVFLILWNMQKKITTCPTLLTDEKRCIFLPRIHWSAGSGSEVKTVF